MELIKKYFWVALLVIAFVLGVLISKGPDKELIHKFETEREVHRQEIERRDRKIKTLQVLQNQIQERRSADSIEFVKRLQTKETTINGLKKRLNEVDFRNYKSADLDSIRAIILRAG